MLIPGKLYRVKNALRVFCYTGKDGTIRPIGQTVSQTYLPAEDPDFKPLMFLEYYDADSTRNPDRLGGYFLNYESKVVFSWDLAEEFVKRDFREVTFEHR